MDKISDPVLRDMIENEDKYIAMMSKWPDKKLSKYIDIINAQLDLAWEKKDDRALARLDAMWRQVVAARFIELWGK